MESRPCKIRHVTLKIFRQHIDLIHRRKLIHHCLIDVPTPSRAAKSFLPESIHLVQQVARRVCMLVGSRRNFWGAFTWHNARLSGISTSHFSFGLWWHFFEWARRLPSMRDNAEPCTFWWLRSCLIFCCKATQSGNFTELLLDHELQWRKW